MGNKRNENSKVAKFILASIFGLAGFVCAEMAGASDLSSVDSMDDATAEQVVKVLLADSPKANRAGVHELLQARSVEELSPEQKAHLFELIQKGAKRIESSEKPVF